VRGKLKDVVLIDWSFQTYLNPSSSQSTQMTASVVNPDTAAKDAGPVSSSFYSKSGELGPVKVTPTKHDIATGRDPGRVKIFDTTLRDGEQSPGCTLTADVSRCGSCSSTSLLQVTTTPMMKLSRLASLISTPLLIIIMLTLCWYHHPAIKQEKVQVARQLAKLGVDILEAGFPIASPGDFDAVSRIAETVGRGVNPPIICGLARALKKDIQVWW